jgi:hypothetical protein
MGQYAFSACRGLTSICIPRQVVRISHGCFKACDNLSSVTFEPGSEVVSIESEAFAFCEKLQSIHIPASTKSIAQVAFWKCPILSSVTFESGSKLSAVHPLAFEGCFLLGPRFLPSSEPSRCKNCASYCSMLNIDLIKNDFTCAMEVKELPTGPERGESTDDFWQGYQQALADFCDDIGSIGICSDCSVVTSYTKRSEAPRLGFPGSMAVFPPSSFGPFLRS